MEEKTVELSELNCPELVEGKWYVYILSCKDGSFYVGSTGNVGNRLREHQLGEDTAWTKYRRPVHLVYWESYDSLVAARQRERQVKGWTRVKKLKLVHGEWKQLTDLD